MKYIIGIDGGTTCVKAVLFDIAGHEIEKVTVENDIFADSTRSEMDMEIFWEKTAACVHLLMEKGEINPDRIWAIGVTGQGEGLWALNAYKQPVGNAILWNDSRAVEYADAVNEKTPGIGRLIHRNLGAPVGPGSTLILLKWLKENRLEVYSEINTVFFAKDWLRFRMTGDIATDYTDAGTAFLKITDGQTVDQLLTILEIKEAAKWMAPVLASDAKVGILNVPAASKMGLNAGTPVVVGSMDVAAAALGMGAIHPKEMTVALGTTCATAVIKSHRECDFSRCFNHYLKHSIEGSVLELSSTLNGIKSIGWVMKEIARTGNHQVVEGMVAEAEPGCGGVIYHPYLAAAGERMPFRNSDAKASFFGVSEFTTKNELLRAVYEGVAYAVRDCVAGTVNNGTILLSGGGASSAILCQMIADVTSLRVVTTGGEEMAARGVAIMAGICVGVYENYEEAVKKCCRIRKIYPPKPLPVYEKTYQLYKELRQSFGPLWKRRAEILEL